ncbi:MAG: ComF family protein [Candidatus Omnitrophica bacterium]|nr:ComF family protein [Candidatus Omnitrophota bacterium]
MLASLIGLLYPNACLLCRAPLPSRRTDRHLLCGACQQRLPRTRAPYCVRCGAPLAAAFDAIVRCRACRDRPPAFEMARAPLQYAGTGQTLLRQIKYHHRWRLSRWLANDMAALAASAFPLEAITLLAPVPAHWLKRRMRGAHPTDELGRDIARLLQKPYAASALRCVRWTRAQHHLPSPGARWRNVRHAFVAQPRLVNDRAVLLIDDVMTSRATAHACAAALKEAGARAVYVLTGARTPLHE